MTSFVIVNSSGGVVQNTEAWGDEPVVLTIDWDEINEVNEEEAQEYATNLLDALEAFPQKVQEDYRKEIKRAMDRRGFEMPDVEL